MIPRPNRCCINVNIVNWTYVVRPYSSWQYISKHIWCYIYISSVGFFTTMTLFHVFLRYSQHSAVHFSAAAKGLTLVIESSKWSIRLCNCKQWSSLSFLFSDLSRFLYISANIIDRFSSVCKFSNALRLDLHKPFERPFFHILGFLYH